jgi:hypothetical protein
MTTTRHQQSARDQVQPIRQQRQQDVHNDTSDYDILPTGEAESKLRSIDHVIKNLEDKTSSLTKLYR